MEIIHTADAGLAVAALTQTIKTELERGAKVLWLVSGGSGAKVSIEVAKALTGTNMANLHVSLSDERYGAIGHPDENWQQLLDGGFALDGATLYRPLTGDDREETARKFNEWLEWAITTTDYAIGLFGIGPDGHTAGIKPHSPAVEAQAMAIAYKGEDFERITITPAFIERLDAAIIQAFGAQKFETIATLIERSEELAVQPAQVLKHIPSSVLYTDYMEEHS